MRPGDRLRATYEFLPVDHLIRAEFYIWDEAIARWKGEGLPDDYRETRLFGFEDTGYRATKVNLGWCEPPFLPAFETCTLEAHGDYEIIQDFAGRTLKVFTGRRHGFMPHYLKHPLASMADWEALLPRLNPADPARWEGLPERVAGARADADGIGGMLEQEIVGGYMYLRALMGPEDLLYAFCDLPEVIHAAMRGWFDIMDVALARVQAVAPLDVIYFAEDICYNRGLLISPATFREFLTPYYDALLSNARARQRERLYFKVDTDGDCRPAIPLYRELGLDAMAPFEVASGCDVVEIGADNPWLVMHGGIDKRVLAAGPAAIEEHLQHILPPLVARGGFYPTCDHGVPDDVALADYMYYRRRAMELDHV